MVRYKKSDDSTAPRESVKGNWQCAGCGTAITELPFEPAGDRPIYCKECWSEKRNSRGGGGRRDFGPRRMFQGNWQCADCGKQINELPFEPSGNQPIRCKECWMKTKNQ